MGEVIITGVCVQVCKNRRNGRNFFDRAFICGSCVAGVSVLPNIIDVVACVQMSTDVFMCMKDATFGPLVPGLTLKKQAEQCVFHNTCVPRHSLGLRDYLSLIYIL